MTAQIDHTFKKEAVAHYGSDRDSAAVHARDTALDQYTRCAYVLRQIFAIEGDKSYLRDGVGSCRIDGTREDHFGSRGVIFDWGELRQARHPAQPWKDDECTSACPYHVPDKGCPLGELSAPTCLSFVNDKMDLPKEFHKLGEYPKFSRDLYWFLNSILAGSLDPEVLRVHEKYVQDFLTSAKAILAKLVKRNLSAGEKISLVLAK